MSATIDERVVQMRFDNRQFETGVAETMTTLDKFHEKLNFTGAVQGFDDINKAANGIELGGVINAVSQVEAKFSVMSIAAISAINNIVTAAMNAGEKIVKSLTIDQVTAGFDKYTRKSEAVQTIMNSTGLSVDEVSQSLDRLSWFTDETSYNFSDMVSNIAKFTNNKVPLEKAISAIQGVALVAADAGANANEASRAMYNFSQAIATGSIKLIDWKSIENANMATATFKENLLESAVALGTVKKVGDEYKTALKGTTISVVDFNSALAEGWLTNDVLMKSLGEYSAYADKIYSVSDAFDTCADAMAATSEVGMELGARAFKAGQQARTFTDAINATKDAVSSGWMQTFEIMFGNYEESVELWTALTNTLWDIFASGAEARNEIMAEGLTTGWKNLIHSLISDGETYKEEILNVARDHGIAVDEMIEKTGSFEKSLQEGWASANILAEALGKIVYKTQFLSDEELEAIGYTRESADSFKDLWEAIASGEEDISEIANTLGRMSGRENLIQALSNAFQALLSIITPVKEAFREVFPAITGERLWEITNAIKEFTAELILSEDASETLKNVAIAIFKPLKLVVDILAKGVGFVANFALGIWKLVDAFLAMFTAGDPIGDLKSSIFGNEAYAKMLNAFNTIVESAKNIFIGFRDAVVNAVQSFGKTDTSGIDDFAEDVESKFKPFTIIGRVISGAFDLISKAFAAAVPIFSNLASALGSMISKIADGISNLDFNALAQTFNAVTFSTVISGISLTIKWLAESILTLGSAFNGLTGIARGIRWTFESISGVLDSMAWDIKAKTLIKVGVAIGILAASLYAIGKLDPGRIGPALAAITAMFVELIAALKAFSEVMSGKSSASLSLASVGMIAMASAILILAAAVRVLSSLNWDQLAIGLTGVFALTTMLSKAAKQLSQSKGSMITGGIGLIAFAAAVRVLVESVEALSVLNWDQLAKGLVGVGVLCAEIALFLKVADFDGVGMFKGVGLIALGAAVRILASSVEVFAQLDAKQIFKGLAAIGAILTELALFTKFTADSKGMISTALGLTILSGAMLVYEKAVEGFAQLKWEEIAKGLTAMAGVLLEVGIAMNLLPKNMIGLGLGMVAVAGAVTLLANAFTTFGGMQWEEVKIAVVGLAGALTTLAIALNLAQGTLSGAAALMTLSVALAVFVPIFKSLSDMKWETVGAGLLYLAATLGTLGLAALILKPVTPALLALAGAVALFGAACLGVGVGVLALSAGLSGLALGGTAAAGAIVMIFSSLLSLIPFALEKLGEGIVALFGVLSTAKSSLIGFVAEMISSLSQAVIESAPVATDAIVVLLDNLLGKLSEHFPDWLDAGFAMIDALLEGLLKNLDGIIDAAVKIVLTFVEGVEKQFPVLVAAAFDFVLNFIDAIGEAFEEYAPKLLEKVTELGGHIIMGLIKGFLGSVNKIKETILNVGGIIVDSFKDFFKIKSPSRVMKDEVGRYLVEGIAEGITKNMSAEEAAKKKASNIVSAFKDAINKYSRNMTTIDLEQQLWESMYGQNASESEIYAKQTEVMAKKLQEQTEIVKLATAEYKATMQMFGESADQTQEAYNKYLQEQIKLSDMTNQLNAARQTQVANQKQAADTYFRLLIAQTEMLRENGFTDEEIKAWAREQSGYTANYDLSSAKTELDNTKQIIEGYLDEVEVIVSDKTATVISNAAKMGVQGASESVDAEAHAIGEKFADGVTDTAPAISNAFDDALDNVDTSDSGQALVDGIIDSINEKSSDLAEGGEAIFNTIHDAFDAAADINSPSRVMYESGTYLMEGVALGIEEASGTVTVTLDAVMQMCIMAVRATYNDWHEAGEYVTMGLVAGMESKIQDAVSMAVKIAMDSYNAVLAALGINSPAKKFIEVGRYVDLGFVEGLKRYSSLVSKASEDVGDESVLGMSRAIDTINDFIGEHVDISPTIRPVVDLDAVEEGSEKISSIFGQQRGFNLSGSVARVGSTAKAITSTTRQNQLEKAQAKEGAVTNNYTFNQTNTSPKALNNVEIYRESKNLFSQLKEATRS